MVQTKRKINWMKKLVIYEIDAFIVCWIILYLFVCVHSHNYSLQSLRLGIWGTCMYVHQRGYRYVWNKGFLQEQRHKANIIELIIRICSIQNANCLNLKKFINKQLEKDWVCRHFLNNFIHYTILETVFAEWTAVRAISVSVRTKAT